MDAMDLVITSCTSIAHAAAALGKPTWVIVPILPYYIWALPGNKSPWYDSVTLFRQEVYKEWQQTFAKLDLDPNLRPHEAETSIYHHIYNELKDNLDGKQQTKQRKLSRSRAKNSQ
jgi:hypothetical protein